MKHKFSLEHYRVARKKILQTAEVKTETLPRQLPRQFTALQAQEERRFVNQETHQIGVAG